MAQITILAGRDQDAVLNRQADVEDTHCQTMREAKARARHLLTEDYRLVSEASERMMYAAVYRDGVCMEDYFG